MICTQCGEKISEKDTFYTKLKGCALCRECYEFNKEERGALLSEREQYEKEVIDDIIPRKGR